MNSAIERLLALRVADVMTRNVTVVSPHQTMEEAAEKLGKHRLSGAPVVDELGHCVGILSATDFMIREAPNREGDLLEPSLERGPDNSLHISAAIDDRVSRHMSEALHTIGDEATLLDAARTMCQHHVHRLPVLDAEGHVIGLISSLDVAAALVNAIEE